MKSVTAFPPYTHVDILVCVLFSVLALLHVHLLIAWQLPVSSFKSVHIKFLIKLHAPASLSVAMTIVCKTFGLCYSTNHYCSSKQFWLPAVCLNYQSCLLLFMCLPNISQLPYGEAAWESISCPINTEIFFLSKNPDTQIYVCNAWLPEGTQNDVLKACCPISINLCFY